MSASKRIAIVGGILALAVCAALPFRRPQETGSGSESQATSGVPWRSHGYEVPLEVRGRLGDSPAEGLYDEKPQDSANPPSAAVLAPQAIDRVGTPPVLPPVYPTIAAGPIGLNTRSPDVSRETPANDTLRTIQHRIADGDTLQSLARRYLNDRSRFMEIYELNPQLENPQLLPIGAVIAIPVESQ